MPTEISITVQIADDAFDGYDDTDVEVVASIVSRAFRDEGITLSLLEVSSHD